MLEAGAGFFFQTPMSYPHRIPRPECGYAAGHRQHHHPPGRHSGYKVRKTPLTTFLSSLRVHSSILPDTSASCPRSRLTDCIKCSIRALTVVIQRDFTSCHYCGEVIFPPPRSHRAERWRNVGIELLTNGSQLLSRQPNYPDQKKHSSNSPFGSFLIFDINRSFYSGMTPYLL